MTGLDLEGLLLQTRNDPDAFNDVFIADGKFFWKRQREMCDSVVKYRRTIVYSGNMIGKDFWVGRIVWWWLLTRPGSLVMITGPSQTSLGSITWKEVRAATPRVEGANVSSVIRSKLSQGVKTSPQLVELKPGWQAMGISTTTVERFSGHHNPNLLVIIDEASALEPEIRDSIESLGYERLVAIGNPIRADGPFIEWIRQAEVDARDGIPDRLATNAIQIPSTDSPHAEIEKSHGGLPTRRSSNRAIAPMAARIRSGATVTSTP